MFYQTHEKMLLMKGVRDFQSFSFFARTSALPQMIVREALDSRANAEPCALLCHTYMKRDAERLFTLGLLNLCRRYTFDTKFILEHKSRYGAFLTFLNELYFVSKPGVLQESEGLRPESISRTILVLIFEVCKNILQQESLRSEEIECLFLTVSSIGQEVEYQDPGLLDALINTVRDAFLRPSTPDLIKYRLMELLELRGARWHLTTNALDYYYSN